MAVIERDKNIEIKFHQLEKDLVKLQGFIRPILLSDDEKPLIKTSIIELIVLFYQKRGPILGNFTLNYKGKTFFEGESLDKIEFKNSGFMKYIQLNKRKFEEKEYKKIIKHAYFYYYFHLPKLGLNNTLDMDNVIEKLKACQNVDEVLDL